MRLSTRVILSSGGKLPEDALPELAGPLAKNHFAILEPTKPQPPVMSKCMSLRGDPSAFDGLGDLPIGQELFGPWAQTSDFSNDDSLLGFAGFIQAFLQERQLCLALSASAQFGGSFVGHVESFGIWRQFG